MGRWCAGKKTERERQKRCFSKKRCPSPFPPPSRPPRRRASKVRRCTFCQRPATTAPARTPAPVSLWDPRAARSFASAHAPSEGNGDSRRSCAAGAAHRAPTSSSCSAPQKPHSPVPPDPCATPARTAFFAALPSGAAASTHSELRRAVHTARTALHPAPRARSCCARRTRAHLPGTW